MSDKPALASLVASWPHDRYRALAIRAHALAYRRQTAMTHNPADRPRITAQEVKKHFSKGKRHVDWREAELLAEMCNWLVEEKHSLAADRIEPAPAASEPLRKPSFDDPKRQLSAKPKLAELVGKLQHNYQAFPAPFAHEKSYWEKNGPVNCTACQFQVALAELRALVEEWCVYNPHPSTPISETYHNCKESLARRNHEA